MLYATRPALPRSAAGIYNPWMIAVIVSIAPFMEILDTTIANVALTHISGSLAASQDQSTWILTSYLVSNAVILPISGWLSNVVGRKRFYMICVALFTISSVLCATATSLDFMLFARVLQGLGGGGLAPSTQSMLADSFPPSKRGQVFALYGLTVVAAPAIGPVLGGYLTDTLSWHWVFLINLPVGLIAMTLVSIFVSEPPVIIEERRAMLARGINVDYVGFALVALGFGTLQIFLDQFSEDDGFGSPLIRLLFVIFTVCIATLMVWEWNHDQPVMNVRLFRHRSFAIANFLLFMLGFMLLSSSQLLPQFTQSLLGYSSESSGMVLGLGGVATILIMPLSGILTGRVVPAKWLILGAFAEMGVAFLILSHINLDVSFDRLAMLRVLSVMALPFMFIPISTVSYDGLPAASNAEASAITNFIRNLGSSVGISFSSTMLAHRTQFHHARLVETITPYNSLAHYSIPQLQSMVQTQAVLLSYTDIFYVLGVMTLMSLPVILLIRTSSGPPKGASLAH
ncbi:MAG TPA: DHA2 family efflux MFS transporter permease subunit [Acetobacteraceae bacterium]|jgi:DHA2 family multidrug resistance protein|nr:DHA2 family efflux MFS transporter permease subunit [Acetobacteraceae bacterium]